MEKPLRFGMTGRANPNQLLISEQNLKPLASLRTALIAAHVGKFGSDRELVLGLQLTHSGRFARPNPDGELASRLIYRHPVLDRRYNLSARNCQLLTDSELWVLIDDFVSAAKLAAKIGFDFVDIKHCHGYLGHELLSAFGRPGPFGGSFENRTRFLREIVARIQSQCPDLSIGVRLSVFDFCPFRAADSGVGEPDCDSQPMPTFGGDETGIGIDLSEPKRLLQLLTDLGVDLLCTTAGSPYYNPHIQRPAFFPPSDGYLPPEDPLIGVGRQLNATRELKRSFPNLVVVGSGYSYLQEWLPNVGQAVVENGWADSIGLGRMALAYPNLPADILAGHRLSKSQICRTFSDCTSAPRNGLVSGCFPLDPFYKTRPERKVLLELKGLRKITQNGH